MITGAFGFIGRNLVKELKKDSQNSLVLWGKDVCETIAIKNNFDVIYHLAANTDTRFPNDVEMYRNNILGFLSVLDFALKGKSKLIYASSASQFGNYKKTAYAESKILIDRIAEHFFDKLPMVGLRFFNVFGSGEKEKGKMSSMVTQWTEQLKAEKRPRAFLEERKTKRDHIYVKDVIKALRVAVEVRSGIYDVGSGKPATFDRVLNLVQKYLGTERKPIYIHNPYKEHYQKGTKANLNWDFEPDYSLEEGIKDYLIHKKYEKS